MDDCVVLEFQCRCDTEGQEMDAGDGACFYWALVDDVYRATQGSVNIIGERDSIETLPVPRDENHFDAYRVVLKVVGD